MVKVELRSDWNFHFQLFYIFAIPYVLPFPSTKLQKVLLPGPGPSMAKMKIQGKVELRSDWNLHFQLFRNRLLILKYGNIIIIC